MTASTSSGEPVAPSEADGHEEHFKPVGTMFIVAVFVVALVLLWASVYVILLSRGVTT